MMIVVVTTLVLLVSFKVSSGSCDDGATAGPSSIVDARSSFANSINSFASDVVNRLPSVNETMTMSRMHESLINFGHEANPRPKTEVECKAAEELLPAKVVEDVVYLYGYTNETCAFSCPVRYGQSCEEKTQIRMNTDLAECIGRLISGLNSTFIDPWKESAFSVDTNDEENRIDVIPKDNIVDVQNIDLQNIDVQNIEDSQNKRSRRALTDRPIVGPFEVDLRTLHTGYEYSYPSIFPTGCFLASAEIVENSWTAHVNRNDFGSGDFGCSAPPVQNSLVGSIRVCACFKKPEE